MAFVVIRRFRDNEALATSRSYQDERPARELAREWVAEGWDVEFIENGRLQHRSTRVTRPTPRGLPEHT
ncbi:MAG: hypothetical protein ABR573_05350 [Candidatus Dormibacteria bacterium]